MPARVSSSAEMRKAAQVVSNWAVRQGAELVAQVIKTGTSSFRSWFIVWVRDLFALRCTTPRHDCAVHAVRHAVPRGRFPAPRSSV